MADILNDDAAPETSPLVQKPLDETDTFSSNDENDIDEETMYVTQLRIFSNCCRQTFECIRFIVSVHFVDAWASEWPE